MRVISKHPKLSGFWAVHPDAKGPLSAWCRLVEHATWKTFADVCRDYPYASAVGAFIVFNVGGNKYRLVAKVAYPKGKVFIHRIMTHKEYDRGDWKEE